MDDNQLPITHGIVHAGFIGFRRFMARKKSRCKLIGFRLVIPHDTIPSTVVRNLIHMSLIMHQVDEKLLYYLYQTSLKFK